MSYVSSWAHENQWMVVNVPKCETFTDGSQEIFRFKNGLYLQPILAKLFLLDLRTSNEYLFRTTEVNMDVYGKYDISGIKDGEPEPCPKVWDRERNCFTDAWKEHLFDYEIKQLQQKYEEMTPQRCATNLLEPKSLMDIVDLGIA